MGVRGGLLHFQRSSFQIERHSGGEHLDMTDFFSAGLEKHVAISRGAACAKSLEEVLQTDADFALDAADGLLQRARTRDRVFRRGPDIGVYLRRDKTWQLFLRLEGLRFGRTGGVAENIPRRGINVTAAGGFHTGDNSA